MSKCNIVINNMRVCPYDNDSKLSKSFAFSDDFEKYNHFVLSHKMTALAVTMRATNLDYGEIGKKPRRYPLTVALKENGRLITSVDFTLHAALWVYEEDPHVDIPLSADDIDTNVPYTLEIVHKKTGELMASKTIAFFRPEVLHVRHIQLVEAYLEEDGMRYRNLCLGECERRKLVLSFVNMGFRPECMPEIAVRMHYHSCTDDLQIVPLDHRGGDMYTAEIEVLPWYENRGVIYIEVLLLGKCIGGVLFSLDRKKEEGVYKDDELLPIDRYLPEKGMEIMDARIGSCEPEEEEKPEPLTTLDHMVGLEDVKAKLHDYSVLMNFFRMRKEGGLPTAIPPLHAMFLGSPGTGKTTVAGIIGTMLHDMGMLSKGHVVVRERATLLGQFYSSESEKTLEALEEAQGGILFIDEAYQLFQPDDPKDPGRFVLDTLMTALADESRRDWMLILAGYTEPTQQLLTLNPGLSSRIPQSNIYRFEDYSPSQLSEIAERYLAKNNYAMTADAQQAIRSLMATDYSNRGKDFGNARHVMNVIQTGIIPSMARRLSSVASPTMEQLTTIMAMDVPQPMKQPLNKRRQVGFPTC
ncbi:AAA family ATPase [Prevotella sp. PINT]|uniref:AAA family ATPase n=1 Tax=Palleniella intestinalis TaxID=2736291 RepID=UPI001554E52D|nr:AAA family ATPase [Palleniella intestinalis]NPD82636.1 AAA family ATPase [Palleniella intestinalis]